jgi:AcrR family transcriptional regulator
MFAGRGFDGTSVADLVEAVGMSKAAFGYHFDSKDALLQELADPLLTDLEAIEDRAQPTETYISEYVDVLLRHAELVTWIDGDRSVLSHRVVGPRLAAHLARMRQRLTGDQPDSEVLGSMALASMWRPIRNLDPAEVADHRSSVVHGVLATLST